MLVSTRPCTETVAEPGVSGGALESQPASATTATAAAMILIMALRTSCSFQKPAAGRIASRPAIPCRRNMS
jgi:hypothetical protein